MKEASWRLRPLAWMWNNRQGVTEDSDKVRGSPRLDWRKEEGAGLPGSIFCSFSSWHGGEAKP